MNQRRLRRVVATSAGDGELHDLLLAVHLQDLVESESTSSDAQASKPDPDIVVAAIARSGLPCEHRAMLGDTPYDIEAAERAGIPIIALRSGGWTDRDLRGAAAVYDDPADLVTGRNTHIAGPQEGAQESRRPGAVP